MSVPAWPSTVPHESLRDLTKIPAPFIAPDETDFDGGNTRQRSKPGSNVAQVQWGRHLTQAQFTTLDTFLRTTLNNGSIRFTMPVRLNGVCVTKTVQIVAKSLAIEEVAGGNLVTMTLRVYGM